MIDIQFNFEKNKYKLDHDFKESSKFLYKYINSKFIKCGKLDVDKINLTYNFVSKSQQIKINKEFKDHDYNTDIITFDMSVNDCELTGDVYISIKQVKKNTKKFNTTLELEINRVLIHGFLHLVGYNDESKLEKREMKKQENKYLKYLSRKFHVEHKFLP